VLEDEITGRKVDPQLRIIERPSAHCDLYIYIYIYIYIHIYVYRGAGSSFSSAHGDLSAF